MTTATTSSPEAIYSPFGRISRGTYWLRLLSISLGVLGAVWWGNGLLPGAIILVCLYLLPLQVMKRGRDAGWGAWIALLLLLPAVNGIAMVALGVAPTHTESSEISPVFENETTPAERARDMDELIKQMK